MFRYWLNQNNSRIQLINLASLIILFLDFDVIFMSLQNLVMNLSFMKQLAGLKNKNKNLQKVKKSLLAISHNTCNFTPPASPPPTPLSMR